MSSCEDATSRLSAAQIIMAVSALACALHVAASTPVRAALADGLDGNANPIETVATPDSRLVRLAQASSKNPIAAFFSLFAKKKPRRTPVIQVPRTPGARGGLLQGRRIFNPYITGGPRPDGKLQPSRTWNTGRRTMCVRLCDGFYWPMKRGGTNNSLMTDQRKCESQCTSKSRLFVLRSSTDNIASMRDLGGRAYSKLKNAFAYRKSYNPSCGCRPKPWSERAMLRHKGYSAVGRERQELAIRSIRLDLRSSLKPTVRTVALNVTTGSTAGAGKRFGNPVLPSRKPFRAPQGPSPLALSRAMPGLVARLGVSHAGTVLPDVGILSFGDLPTLPPSRIPGTRMQSDAEAGSVVTSSRVLHPLNLRNRLN